jgi:hypothetical protein
LVDDELRESLIMGKVVQHLAESSDKGKELRSALVKSVYDAHTISA